MIFSYHNTAFPIEGDSSGSLYGKNMWLTGSGNISSKAWHRYNWGDPDVFGKHSGVTSAPHGITLFAKPGFKLGTLTPCIGSGFVLKEGVYASRVRFSSLSQFTRAIQAFWLFTPDHYRFKSGNDSIIYVNKVDFEWNNHFSGQGQLRVHAATIGAVHSKKGLIGTGFEIRLFKKNLSGVYEAIENSQEAYTRYVENKWWNFYIKIDSAKQVTEFSMEYSHDEGMPRGQIAGGSVASATKVLPVKITEHYPRTHLSVLYNFGAWPNTADSLLTKEISIDVDWFYYTPNVDIGAPEIAQQVDFFKSNSLPRINTTGKNFSRGHIFLCTQLKL
ncbi:MAG TPA: hypothetical protein VEC36_13625 [Patescibacteria group bacterium]|nr:hypothetical protein [Patescibacteria group bacterium]